jgi:hypothetical protein
VTAADDAGRTDGPTDPTDHLIEGKRTMTKPRRHRTALLAVVALLAIAIPAAAQTAGFRDVSPRYVHAPGIEDLVEAGITKGCATGRYCPNDPVTRGAMASFLTRAGAQAYGAASATTLAAGTGNVNGVPVTLDVTSAGESGGTQHAALHGSVTVTVTADQANTDCTTTPCEVEAYIYRARGEVVGPRSFATVGGDAGSSISLSVGWATTIATARTEQYRIAVFIDGTEQAAGYHVQGTLNAVTAPFGDVAGG